MDQMYPILAKAVNKKNVKEIRGDIKRAQALGLEVHFDVMDGEYVSQRAGCHLREIKDLFDPCRVIRAHFMVNDSFFPAFNWSNKGAQVVMHTNALEQWQWKEKCVKGKIGIALNPNEPADMVSEYVKKGEVDHILVMAGPPGLSGQSFDWSVLEKIREIKSWRVPGLTVGVDIGVNGETIPHLIKAGADILNSDSWISKDPAGAIAEFNRMRKEVKGF